MAKKKTFKERMKVINAQLRGMSYTDIQELQKVVNSKLEELAGERIEELKRFNEQNLQEIKELEKLVK